MIRYFLLDLEALITNLVTQEGNSELDEFVVFLPPPKNVPAKE